MSTTKQAKHSIGHSFEFCGKQILATEYISCNLCCISKYTSNGCKVKTATSSHKVHNCRDYELQFINTSIAIRMIKDMLLADINARLDKLYKLNGMSRCVLDALKAVAKYNISLIPDIPSMHNRLRSILNTMDFLSSPFVDRDILSKENVYRIKVADLYGRCLDAVGYYIRKE